MKLGIGFKNGHFVSVHDNVVIGENANIRDFVTIEEGAIIGNNFETGYSTVIRTDVRIGNDVCIWSHCTIDPMVVIGNNVKIHNLCYIAQGTIVEDDAFLAPGVLIANDKYPPRYDSKFWESPIIKQGASIGAGVIICPGVTIGKNSIIGAGAVVVRDVPANQIWLGVPAARMR